MTICIGKDSFFDLKVNRKAIKNAYIRVKHNNILEVSVPLRMPHNLVVDLLKQKSQWILSVSKTLGESFEESEINLTPISQDEINDMRYEAENAVYESLDRMYPLLNKYKNIALPEVRVRYMTTRWGSCIIPKRRVWINVYLVKLPRKCLDFVLLHELIHFLYPHHNKDFYKVLTELMPEWKEYKEMLKKVKLPPKNIKSAAVYI